MLPLWGSRTQPESLTCSDQRCPAAGIITGVSLRLLYLIFMQALGLLSLLGRSSTSKDSTRHGEPDLGIPAEYVQIHTPGPATSRA